MRATSISPRQLIEVARPALWSTQFWFYLLPLAGCRLFHEPSFWLGALYVTFPLGLLLYGWNDWADYETDRLNSRKGNWLFGAKLSPEALRQLPWVIAVVQLPFFITFLWLIGAKFLVWIAAALAINACYNLPQINFKSRPVVDVLSQSGYLLVFVLASWVNDVPQLAWPAYLFGLLFAMHSHLLAEITDIEPDRAAGRRTTAVVIGAANSKLIVAGFLLVEAAVVLLLLGKGADASGSLEVGRGFVGAFLAIAGLGLLADYWVRGKKLVTNRQLAAVLVTWNIVAVASMFFLWKSGLFAGR